MPTVVGDLVVFLRANTMPFNVGMMKASKQLSMLGKSMNRVGSLMTMKMSLPMALVGGAAAKMAMDFETSMQQIVGLVGVAQDQVNEWREDIVRIGPSLSKTSTELGKAMFFITSAGLRGSSALSALEASAKGAAAGLGETTGVADAATSAMNAYGEANLSAEMAVSVLVATVREGKAEASSLAPVLGRIIPIAAELGVEFHEVGGAMAVMTRLGLNANESATALRGTLATILKPSQQAEKEMAKYGMSMLDLKKILREKGLIALLTKLRDTFGDNEESMQKVFRNVRALNGVLSIVGKNVSKNVKIFKSLANTTEDDLNNAFKVASKTAKFKFNAAMADLQNTFIELGDVVLPTLIPMVKGLGETFRDITTFLDRMTPRQREMVTGIGLWAIALGPLIWALSKVLLLLGGLGTAMATWNGVLLGTLAPTGAATAALSGLNIAIGTVAASTAIFTVAIGAIGLAIGLLIGNFLRPYVNELLGLNEAFGLVAHQATDLTDGMLESDTAFENAAQTLGVLKDRLHLAGQEWDFVNEKTRVNAERIQLLTDKALAVSKKQQEIVALVKEEQTVRERALDIAGRASAQVATGLEKANAAQKTRLDALKEELGLLTKGDVNKSLSEMVGHYEDMKSLGIDNKQLGEAFSDEMLHLLTLAKENKIELPAGTKAMADDLKKDINPAIGKLVRGWRTFNVDAGQTGKMLEGIFFSTGEKAQAALRGGFKNGIEQGVEEGGVAMDAFVKRIEDKTIFVKIAPDVQSIDDFNRAVQDAVSGRSPGTGG